MNFENNNTNESHKFAFNLSRRLDLRRLKKNVALPKLSVYYTWKKIRKHYKNNKLKKVWTDDYELQMLLILCQIQKIISNISLKT